MFAHVSGELAWVRACLAYVGGAALISVSRKLGHGLAAFAIANGAAR